MHWLVLAAVFSAGVVGVGLGAVAWHGPQRDRPVVGMEGTILTNGASEDAAVLSGEWHVTWVAETTLPPDAPMLLRFAPGRVTGLAGCSNFQGDITLDGNSFSLGPVESDGTECSPEWMQATSDFLRMLSLSSRLEVGADGRLKLYGANIATIEAVR